MIALLTQEEGTVVVTDGLGNNHTLPSFPQLRKEVAALTDDLAGSVSQVRDIASVVTALAAGATLASEVSEASADRAEHAASSAKESATRAESGSEKAAAEAARASASADTAASRASSATTSALIASDHAVAASGSAASAESSASSAALAKVSAEEARDKANLYANAPQGTQVAPGEYSAKHWAAQAKATATGSLVYMGSWDASSGSFPPEPVKGHFYKVVGEGQVGGTEWHSGDQALYGTTWEKIDNTDQVTSVAGKQGSVTLVAGDIVGLGSLATRNDVDFDAHVSGKPLTYPPSQHTHTKSQVGLDRVDNTSDLEKPISHAVLAALDAKADLVHQHQLNHVHGLDKALDDLRQNAADLGARVDAERAARQTQVDELGFRIQGRNMLINGNLSVWQRRTAGRVGVGSGSLGPTAYFADRFYVAALNCTGDVTRYAPPDGKIYQLVTVSNASAAANSACWGGQMIEGVRSATGKVTVSFLANSSVDGMKVGVVLQQYFGTGGSPAPTVILQGGEITLTTTQQRVEVTFDLPNPYGKNVGTVGDDYIHFLLEFCGGQAGIQNGTITVGEFQIEQGEKATPIEYRSPGYELLLCQRYYELIGFVANSQGAYFTSLSYKVQKRTVPKLKVLGAPIAPATLNHRGSERWFSMDGLATSAVGTYVEADCEY
ncbi:hypothetical protein [Stenotrophomonas maltophilia]|uniref:hypothetical protein n=1 Tax=Stenotrophomonas maltophilia TaxID=40324 RepID=UPI002E7621E1|nr:hypothetical protein [Stenotrophomonas maltophilia]